VYASVDCVFVLNREIQRLASDFMKDYIFLAVGRVGSASKDVIQTIEYAENEEKFEVLIRTLNKVLTYNNCYIH
jgi:ATP-dependent RNA helicase DDX3X